MTKYSLEPPRRDLIFHQTFDIYDEGQQKYVDTSPQSNDATVITGVVRTEPGVVGEAAVIDETNKLEVNSIDTSRTYDELVTSAWGLSEHPIDSNTQNVQFAVDFPTQSTVTLTHTVSSEVNDWQFAAGRVYDDDSGETIVELLYATLGDPEPTVVARKETGHGESVDGTFALEVTTTGYARVDDIRIYDGDIGTDYITDLYDLGNEQQFVDEYGEHWPEAGIPYIRGRNNANLSGSIGSADRYVTRQLDAVHEAHHIDTAAGAQLDRIGAHAGIRRKSGESDAKYRARIKSVRAAARSRGTFEDVLEATTTILDTTKERVELQTDLAATPAEATVYVRRSDLDDAQLTTSEVDELLEDAVPVGHRVQVVEQGASPFTLIADGQANDPEIGLTSDSISTGGGLVSDI